MTLETLAALIRCPECLADFTPSPGGLSCASCGSQPEVAGRQIRLGPSPPGAVPSVRKERGLGKGSPFRRANWAFYGAAAEEVAEGATVLDIGAGHGDLAPLFTRTTYVACDVMPYQEVHLIGDIVTCPFLRPASADAVLLSNVLEHLTAPIETLTAIARALRPGHGRVYVAVPFLIKLHQTPIDYHRYTHYMLVEMCRQAGLRIVRIEAVYAPFFMLRVAIDNVLATIAASGRGRLLEASAGRLLKLAPRVLRRGSGVDDTEVVAASDGGDLPDRGRHAYPLGYQIVLARRD
ncbi:MAG: methyltransferase domain-containing protein [Acidobacteriota bacterium]|nr:methyltransferase domain-containing protein [Acidobacteriota bacterium]